MIKGKSLVMLFSDLLPTTDDWKAEADATLRSLHRLRYAGHEVILFHILDEARSPLPDHGAAWTLKTSRPRTRTIEMDAQRDTPTSFLAGVVEEFRERWLQDRVRRPRTSTTSPMDTSVGFDKALLEYLVQRQRRFA